MSKKRIGILFGGKSVEHEVSIQSSRNVCEAIDQSKFDVVLIGIDKSGKWRIHDQALLRDATSPKTELNAAASEDALALIPGEKNTRLGHASYATALPQLDAIMPLLHGTYGEDGSVQGIMKLADVPFVGAGVLGSAIGMDKDVTKRLLRDAGIPVARFVSLNAGAARGTTFETLVETLGLPFFVKPANAGSSVGVS